MSPIRAINISDLVEIFYHYGPYRRGASHLQDIRHWTSQYSMPEIQHLRYPFHFDPNVINPPVNTSSD